MSENNNVISLEDHFGKTATADPTQTAATGAIECPDYLSEEAKEYWPELAESLTRHGLINELDVHMLAIFCSQLDKFIKLDKALDDPEGPGMTQLTKTGYEAETATFTAWKSMLKPIMTYAKQLGLTPPARVAMKATAPGQEELAF